MKIGLFFGSFNPVHIGHMIIANYLYQYTDLDKIWLVVSPHNPLKNKKSLANDYDRLHLVNLAIGDNPHLQSSNIEFSLPIPSYTIDTLTYLKEKYPKYHFHLIMGSDNILSIHKWKNYELLLRDYEIFIYRRPGSESTLFSEQPNIHYIDAPLLDISSTQIRAMIQEGKSIQYLVPDTVYHYLLNSSLYR